jgi:hypothetical protein
MRSSLAIVFAAIPFPALASWSTTVEDDLFSGGQKAMMIGDINQSMYIVLDCKKDFATITVIEKGEWSAEYEGHTVRGLLKVDSNPSYDFQAVIVKRNSEYFGYEFNNVQIVAAMAKEIKESRSKITVGLEDSAIDFQW